MTSQLKVNRISPATGDSITIDGFNTSNIIPLVNGAMQVWQRGTTQTSTGYGCVDRWKNSVIGTTTFSKDTASLPIGFESALRWTAGASSSYGQSRQYIETSTVKILRGQTLTLSAYVKVSGGFGGVVTFEIGYSTTGDMIDTNTWQQLIYTKAVNAGQDNASSTYKRISCNVDIPSDALGLYIGIVPNTPQASGEWASITGVQLELGDVATPFKHEIYGDTLAKCQRYYQLAGSGAAGTVDGVNSGRVFFTESLPIEMRAIPATAFTGATVTVRHGVSDQTATSPVMAFWSNQRSSYAIGVNGFATTIINLSSTPARGGTLWLELDAELR